ncbi:MAG: condensation domain-containing protein [Aeromicrobium sp.]
MTTWTPVAAPTAWRDDERELSYDHEAHLGREACGAWIGSAMRVPGPFDPDALRRALRAWIVRHEVLRTTVHRRAAGWARRTAGADQVDVQHEVLGRRSGDDAREVVAQFLAALSPVVWPHCVFATVVDPDAPGFVLVFGADHSVMDAYSQLLWFAEMTDLYRRAREGAGDDELATIDVGSHVDFAELDRRSGGDIAADHAAVARWRDFMRLDGAGTPTDTLAFPHHPDLAGHAQATASCPQRSLSTWVLGAVNTDLLNAQLRQRGVGLQSAGIAALALAARRRSGVERLRFVLPLHTRHDPRHVGSVGWYVGLCPIDLDIAGARTLAEAVARADAAVREAKDLARYPFPRIAELLDVDDTPHFVVSYVDVRHVPGADQWPAQHARALRSPARAPDEVYLWLIRSHAGLNISARYPGTDLADAAMRGYVAHARAVLSEMVWDEQPETLAATGSGR